MTTSPRSTHAVPARSRLLAISAIVALAVAWLVAVPSAAQAATGTTVTVSLETDSEYVEEAQLWTGGVKRIAPGETESRRVTYDKKSKFWVRLGTTGWRVCTVTADVTWTYANGNTRTVTKTATNAIKLRIGPNTTAIDIDLVAADDCVLLGDASVNWDGSDSEVRARVTGISRFSSRLVTTLETNPREVDEDMKISFSLFTESEVCVRMVDTYTGKVYVDNTPSTQHKFRVPRNPTRTFDATVISCTI